MLGGHVKIFHPDGAVEQITVRLHPEAHARWAEEVRALSWEPHRGLRTRAELEAEGAPLVEVTAAASDTAAWWAAQRARVEDDALVAAARLRPVLRARSLDEVMHAAMAAVDVEQGRGVDPGAWVAAVRALQPKVPRWDAGVVDLAAWPVTPAGWTDREEYAVSADAAEVVVLVVAGGAVHVERIEHDQSEAAMRATGRLVAEPHAVTRG
jgi:hypothetical protein